MINFKQHEENFEVIEKVGNGGYGTVYKVKNRLDSRTYALKKIKLENDYAEHDEETQKVLKECRTLSLLDHPNILRYYGSWLFYGKSRIHGDLDSPDVKKTSGSIKFDQFTFRLRSDASLDKISPVNNLNRRSVQMSSEEKDKSKEDDDPYREFGRSSFPLGITELDEETESEGSFNNEDNRNSPNNTDDVLYIQTEFCDLNLEQYLSERGRLIKIGQKAESASGNLYRVDLEMNPCLISEAFSISFQLISALKYIHSKQNVIHRDLKPTNIFLNLKSNFFLMENLALS